MLHVLIVSPKNTALSGLETGMKQYDDISVLRADSCQNALDTVSAKAPDLVVADETIGEMTGFDFIKKLVSICPTTNSAVVSTLSASEFHEASEGLRVLMQIPEDPDEKDVDRLIGRLTEVMNLTHLL
jgi:DNA-binding NarL/FixJ family response regulator